MFISSYAAIYLFVNKFVFLDAYIGCLDENDPKRERLHTEGGGVLPHVYPRTYISFHIFGRILVL